MTLALHSRPVYIPLESLPIAAAGLDRDGTILDANRRFLRLFGIGGSNQSAKRLADIVAEIHRPAVNQVLNELCDGEAPARCSIKALRCKADCLWIAFDVTRLGPESIVPCLVCAQPILKRRRLDAAPGGRRRDAAPEGPIETRQVGSQCAGTQAVAPACTGVVRGVESWPPLLTTLSHELRGLLNAIRGWVALAEGGSLPSGGIPRALGIIRRNAETMSGLVENLFDLSRNAAGSLALKLEVLDLNQLVALVVESNFPAAKRHDVALTISCSRSALFVKGDRVRLEQVVRNLVDNAIKFTPGGGKVNLRTLCHPPFGELVVDDTGAGIPPDLLPAVFDPFRRGVLDVQEGDVGVGLGLALVRELVHLHHGEVRAMSRGKDRGSTFTVKLPLASGAAVVWPAGSSLTVQSMR